MTALETLIVGFGGIASGLANDPLMAKYFRYATHAQVLRDNPAFRWVAVVDPDPEARRRARDDWGITEAVGSVEELDDPARFKVAVVTSPASTRLEIVRALQGLKALFLEKPLGANHGLVKELVAECNRRKLLVQVNFWRRGDSRLRSFAEGDLSSKIGNTQAAFGIYGNGLFNNGSHLVDQVRMLLGEVKWASANGEAVAARGPIPDDVQIPFTLGLTSGKVVQIQPVDFRYYRELSLDLWGERGRLQILHEGLTVGLHERAANRGLQGTHEITSDEMCILQNGVSEALFALYDNLAAAIDRGTDLLSPISSAVSTELVLDAVLRSASQSGGRVDL